MAKLTYRYGAMWAWKSLEIIKVGRNYLDRGMSVLVFNHKADTRYGSWKVASRANLSIDSVWYDETFDFKSFVHSEISQSKTGFECLLIDESQFLTTFQVDELAEIATFFDIPVICYGLRTDYRTQLFEGAKRLMEIATTIEEIKTVCWCGKKAIINCRVNEWNIVMENEVINNGKDIGGDDKYESLCYKHYKTHNLWPKNLWMQTT